jgi:hypothetical protein
MPSGMPYYLIKENIGAQVHEVVHPRLTPPNTLDINNGAYESLMKINVTHNGVYWDNDTELALWRFNFFDNGNPLTALEIDNLIHEFYIFKDDGDTVWTAADFLVDASATILDGQVKMTFVESTVDMDVVIPANPEHTTNRYFFVVQLEGNASIQTPNGFNISYDPDGYSSGNWNEVEHEDEDMILTVEYARLTVAGRFRAVGPIIDLPFLQPPYIDNIQALGNEVNLTWILSPSPSVNWYEIYGGPSQISIDFNTILYKTPFEPAPATQFWAQFNFDTVGNPEYYFVVRAVNDSMVPMRSTTSNTAGYYTMNFSAGLNTFSPPLKPFTPRTLDLVMADMGATTISWLNSTDDWLTFPIEPVTPMMEMGKGYVVELPGPLNFIFTGEPGAMIKYTESWGFPAGSLVTASVVGDNIVRPCSRRRLLSHSALRSCGGRQWLEHLQHRRIHGRVQRKRDVRAAPEACVGRYVSRLVRRPD